MWNLEISDALNEFSCLHFPEVEPPLKSTIYASMCYLLLQLQTLSLDYKSGHINHKSFAYIMRQYCCTHFHKKRL